MKKIEFTSAESRVLNCLKIGEENAQSRDTLVTLTGYSDRHVRQQIEQLRRKGIEVMSDSRKRGYWISSGREDKRAFVEQMDKRGKKCIGVVKPVRRELKKAKNQASMFEEGSANESA